MTKWIVTACAAFLLMPLSTEATGSCRHEQNHDISGKARGDHHAARADSVESVPAAGAAAPCPDHAGEPCKIKTSMMLKCNMEGCCIKAGGPLSAGLNDRLPTNDDHALSVSIAQPEANGRVVATALHRLHPQRNLPEPHPRHPAA